MCKIKVNLPPYIVKQPKSYFYYRFRRRLEYLASLGVDIYSLNALNPIIDNHVKAINNWQPRVYTQ